MKKELQKILKGIGYVIGGILGVGYLAGCTEPKEHIRVYTCNQDDSDINKELDRLWEAYNDASHWWDRDEIMKKITKLEEKL